MRIENVELSTRRLSEAVDFYRNVLELPVVEHEARATVTIGRSTLTLTEDPAVNESNHLAITVPSNRFADAKRWLAARVPLMTWEDGQDELQLDDPWFSESVYFLGPDGILLEFIARHPLDNADSRPFSDALVCISEVGLSCPSVADTFAAVRRELGIETFAGESPHFTTAGDHDGLLILVSEDRPWFPTDDLRAATSSVRVTLGGVTPGTVVSPTGWTVVGTSA